MPFISIIIPTYNRAKVIQRALKSILSQAYKDWEVILVDDASTDKTINEIEPYLKNHKIMIVKHSHNQGFFAARNTGIQQAKGEWVSFLDSDDEYLSNGLSTLARELKNIKPHIDVGMFMLRSDQTYGNSNRKGFRRTDTSWDYYQPTYSDIVLKKDVFADMHRCMRTPMAKKYPYQTYNPGLETYHYANLAKLGKQFLYINKDVVLVHEDPANQHSKNRFTKHKKAFRNIYLRMIGEHLAILIQNPRRLFNYLVLIAKLSL